MKTKKLKFDQKCRFLAFSMLAMALVCRADELDEIQKSRETAEMQYVNELASGKYKTPKEKDDLKKKLLDPEEARAREYFQRISAVTPPPKDAESADDLMQKSEPVALPPYSANRTEPALDGSNVPKELTFEPASPPVSKSAPTPAPSNSPGVSPVAKKLPKTNR